MIRHSSSLLLSFILHVIFLFIIIFVYKQLFPKKKEEIIEHRVCVQLCSVDISKPMPIEKKQEIKKTKPKPPPKPKKIEKKVPKKIVKKEVVAKKKILIVKEEVKPVVVLLPPKIIEKKVTPKEEPVVQEVKEVVEVETPSQINQRLEKEYLDENILKIRELISDNLYYPRSARKRGVVGDVMVKFTLSKNADVHLVDIISSKSDILSRAALKTIKGLSGEFPQPKEDLTLHVPISYRLN